MEILNLPLVFLKLSSITLLCLCLFFEFFSSGEEEVSSTPPFLHYFIALLSVGGVFYFGAGIYYETSKWISSGLLCITSSVGIAVSYLMKANSENLKKTK